MTGDTLEPQSPDRLSSTMVAGDVLMLDIFVDIVGELEKLLFIFGFDTSGAKIVVRFVF